MRGKRRRAERSVEQALTEAARVAEQRIATCHERVACPACGVPRGHRCIRKGGGWGTSTPLKHPHRERWTQVVPAR